MDRKSAKLKALLWKIFNKVDRENPPVGQQRILLTEPGIEEGHYRAMGYLVMGRKGQQVAVQCGFLPRLEKKISSLTTKKSESALSVLAAFTNADEERAETSCQALGFRITKGQGEEEPQIPPRKKQSSTKSKAKNRSRRQSPKSVSQSPFSILAGLKGQLGTS